MAYDGIQYGNRVDNFTERKLYAKVVDNVLNYVTYASRIMGQGKPFNGKTEDVTIDVVSDTSGQFFTGVEELNSAASNTTITLSYAQTAFTQPKVSIMTESFANAGPMGTINLDVFKYEKAIAQAQQQLGASIYADGTGNAPLGLAAIVNNSGTIGGQSRSTYSQLNATVTASSGTLSLAKMATLHDAISAAGSSEEEPNVGVTTKTVWSLYEQLLTPQIRNEYSSAGYNALPLRSQFAVKNRAELKGAAGFTAISYRGMPIIKDDFCTSGVLFFLNERYFDWKGRTIVPDEYKDFIKKIDLGTMKAYEGTGAQSVEDMPSAAGWFYQKDMMLPNQAGTIGRVYCIGQVVAKGFRRSGKLTGITGV
jgi:hypothetical protein